MWHTRLKATGRAQTAICRVAATQPSQGRRRKMWLEGILRASLLNRREWSQ